MGGTVSKTTTASSGGQVRGAKKVQRKKSNRRRFDASKVKKSSVKRGSASGSISKKAIEAVTEKGHRKVSQKRQATTVTIIDSGQGSSGVGSPGSGTGDSLNDESDYNNQFSQPSTAFTKKKAATTTTKSQPLHHKGSNHGHHGHAAASSGEGSTETNSPESSDFDDLNDQTCPFCEADWTAADCVHETDEDQAGGPLLYCSKGSLCSRRSKATLKSRKVPGKRKKLPLPPKHQLQQQPQRHPTVSAFIYEVPDVVRTKSSFRDMHRVVRKGYCFLRHLVVLCMCILCWFGLKVVAYCTASLMMQLAVNNGLISVL